MRGFPRISAEFPFKMDHTPSNLTDLDTGVIEVKCGIHHINNMHLLMTPANYSIATTLIENN